MAQPRRSYSDEEKANALLALDANGGKVALTAQQLGLPWSTLKEWKEGRGTVFAVTELREGKRLPLAERFEELAHRCLDLLPVKIEDASPRDLGVIAAIAVDKSRLLREQPTTITRAEEASDAERADRILELLGAGGESGTRPPAGPHAVH